MTFILICFVSELFAWSFPPTIPLTSASSEVNELVLSPVLWFIQEGGFLAELGICCFKSGARIRAYLSRKSSSQSKPLLLMLNGDYAAGMLGSGINAGATGGLCPLAHGDSSVAGWLSLWSGPRPRDQPPRAAPGVDLLRHWLLSTSTYEASGKISKNIVFRFYSFYISNLEKKKKVCWHLP